MPTRTLSAEGRQTREAIEQAARKLFAERAFHRTTLGDITSAAGKSPASFCRYVTVFVGSSGFGVEISDADAIATLSRIWKKTLYGI